MPKLKDKSDTSLWWIKKLIGLGSQRLKLLLLLSHFSHVRLCSPTDGSSPGSPVPGMLQARTLEWVAISFSSARKWKVKVKSLSHVWLLATPWTAAYQAPLFMGFSRQEYWSGVPLPSPRLVGVTCNLLTCMTLNSWESQATPSYHSCRCQGHKLVPQIYWVPYQSLSPRVITGIVHKAPSLVS